MITDGEDMGEESEIEPLEYPEVSVGDTAVELIKGAFSSVVPGGFVLSQFIETERSRRMKAFLLNIQDRLSSVEQADPSCLLSKAQTGDQDARDRILSTYVVITRMVQEAMDEEKRKALAGAMASTLLWEEKAEEMERRYFLRCLTNFEAIHLELLARSREGLVSVKELYNADGMLGDAAKTAWRELYEREMVNTDSVNTMMSSGGMAVNRITQRGSRFLDFVRTEN